MLKIFILILLGQSTVYSYMVTRKNKKTEKYYYRIIKDMLITEENDNFNKEKLSLHASKVQTVTLVKKQNNLIQIVPGLVVCGIFSYVFPVIFIISVVLFIVGFLNTYVFRNIKM